MNESLVKRNFIDYIDNIIKNNKISHAYLIEVGNYDSDYNYVLSFVKMILFHITYKDINNCNNSLIHLIDNNNYPDIRIIEPDGNFIKKGQLLDLQRDYSNKSLLNGKRIYIIKYCEKLNLSSANTILKFLEEPDDDIIAILLTDNRYHVIDTILSRCQILNLKENNMMVESNDVVIDFINNLVNPSDLFIDYNRITKDIVPDKNSFKDLLNTIEMLIIQYFEYKSNMNIEVNLKLIDIFDKIGNDRLINYLSIIEEEIPKLQYNVNYKLWVDSLFSRFVIGG